MPTIGLLKNVAKIQMALALFVAVVNVSIAQTSYVQRRTSQCNAELTISNLGIIGNAFKGPFSSEGWGSGEYPRNSGVEHLFEGGLWVGGKVKGQVRVSTGAFDASSGYSAGANNFEFTAPVGGTLTERSSLIDDINYSPSAVSHQDLIADFSDKNVIIPGTNIKISDHTPIGLDIHFESYNWNFGFADYFVILSYTVTNTGTDTLATPYLGYWSDIIVRNVNVTPPGGTAFYSHGGNGFDDSLSMYYAFDADGDPGFTESYCGIQFLGALRDGQLFNTKKDTAFKCNYQIWNFNTPLPKYQRPNTENERWLKMSGQGMNYRSDWPITEAELKKPFNRISFMSVGPFADLEPGQSIRADFAIVFAKKNEDGKPNTDDNDFQRANLTKNAAWAQIAFNGEDRNGNGILDDGEDIDKNGKLTRYLLPAPPDIPKTKIVALNNKVEIYWSNNSENSIDPISLEKDFEGYALYMSKLGFDIEKSVDVQGSLKLLGRWDKEGNNYFVNNGFESIKLAQPVKFDGDTTVYNYKYVIDNIQNGWQHAITLTAFDKGDAANQLESFESSKLSNMKRVFPGTPANKNPETNEPYVYPNPYYANAAWEGVSTRLEDKKIMFANLPAKCVVRIFSSAGDLIDEFEHNQSYTGTGSLWYATYSDPKRTVFSGGEHAWDIISKNNQIIARGLYLFSVEDLDTGKQYSGKFAIIK